MIRSIRAMVWLRWRVFLNTLLRSQRRDALERFSRVAAYLVPLGTVVFLVAPALALGLLGGFVGWALAVQDAGAAWAFPVVRVLLGLSVALVLLAPLAFAARVETSGMVRFLLLPISRPLLYASQALAQLGDPWILAFVPLLILLPVGLLVAGKVGAAALSLVAGILLIMLILGLSILWATLITLLLRDRRRGETAMLVLWCTMSLMGLGLFMLSRQHEARYPGPRTTVEDKATHDSEGASERTIGVWAKYAPSELYASVVSGATGDPVSTYQPLGILLIVGLALHALGWKAYRRLLETPATTSARSLETTGGAWRRVIPGLSPVVSAVAIANIRLAVRSLRGKMALFSPTLAVLVFSIMMFQRVVEVKLGALEAGPSILLATAGGVWAILGLQPFTLNQFAIDRAGVTLQFLAPISNLDLLKGKAVGLGIIGLTSLVPCFAVAFALAPGGPAGLWIGAALSAVSAYLLIVPGAALLSIIFPKPADLSSLGKAGNPHGLAALFGLIGALIAFVPAIGLALFAALTLQQSAWIPVLLVVWTLCAAQISVLLLRVAANVLEKRRENLAMVAERR